MLSMKLSTKVGFMLSLRSSKQWPLRSVSKWLCVAIALVALTRDSSFGAPGGTSTDYERARNMPAMTRDKVFRQRITANWVEGRPSFWYRVRTQRDRYEFVLVNAVKATKLPAFDHQRLAAALAKSSKRDVSQHNLPFQSIRIIGEHTAVEFRAFGKLWQCDLKSYAVTEAGKAKSVNGSTAITHVSLKNSRQRGAETWIEFQNKTSGSVDVLWIQENGQHRHYQTIAAGKSYKQHTFAGHTWLVRDLKRKPLAVFEAVDVQATAIIDDKLPPIYSRKKKPVSKPRQNTKPAWQAFIKNHNVFLRSSSSGQEVQLSKTGREDDRFSGRLHWSPDSKWLVAIQQKQAAIRQIHLIESSPKDQLQPKLHTLNYAKPGDPRPIDKPRLFNIEKLEQVDVPTELFANPWSISKLHWSPDSSRFCFLYNQRGHQLLRVVAVETSGKASTVIDEPSQTFVDYAHKEFTQYLDESGEILWMSERDGWNHLYLYDSRTRKVKHQVTSGHWVVRKVDRVDTETRQIWFQASGIHPHQDPYHIHYCRVDFDGRNLVKLTDGDGTHSIEFSPDGEYLLARYSRVDLPPVTELRRVSDGKRLIELERADWSELLKSGWKPPERFVAKARDNRTDIYGMIYRPSNFDPMQSYPVIEHIYAGPHSAHVPKQFSVLRKSQMLAELGFVVVRIDGMGTSHRSKAFHAVAWKNLGDAGLPDRIRWIKAAAAKYPWMDLSRVGIHGGSAGGQNALRAMLMHPNFYKVAVADCGCHDNRMDKVWWNELWMSWPIGPHYADQSNVTQAHRLQGKLLLIVGELDRNVDPASTMQVVNALIKADKDFDLLVMPGTGHGSAETKYGTRRRRDFFVRHLLGVEPRRTRP